MAVSVESNPRPYFCKQYTIKNIGTEVKYAFYFIILAVKNNSKS